MENSIRRLSLVSGIYAAAVSVVSVFFLGFNFLFISGLVLGCVTAVLKAVMWGKLPFLLAQGSGKRTGKAISISLGVQFISGIFLFVAAWLNTRFFFGLAAGMVSTVVGALTFIGKNNTYE